MLTDHCPSCGAVGGYGPDEDGYPDCMICGGPNFCPACHDPIRNTWELGDEGFACLVCGEHYHAECLPVITGGSDIMCRACQQKGPQDAA